jgi:hypothetical protein
MGVQAQTIQADSARQ